ncbi:MAG: L-histidine N(alpha)-methyltransferase [Acidimicrobiales bacterium]
MTGPEVPTTASERADNGSDVGIEVHLGPADRRSMLEADVRAGLGGPVKALPPMWFYDQRGSELFEEITELPEYYLCRSESEILGRRADDVAVISGAEALVELGSGASVKTQMLLDALQRQGSLERFVGFDVSEAMLRDASARLRRRYPALEVLGIVGDFHRHLASVPKDRRNLFAILGSTLGNLAPEPRQVMLSDLVGHMAEQDCLLLGLDLIKAPGRLVAAYDDSRGVTAQFNRNVLMVLNNELGADFEPEAFDHVAVWNEQHRWMEMRLRSRHPQVADIPALDLKVFLEQGEEILTEISCKFDPGHIAAEFARSGLGLVGQWMDDGRDFLVVLARPIN